MSESLPPSERPRFERRQGGMNPGALWAGVALIVVGLVFLAQNLDFVTFDFTNWWALFILIPAFGSFAGAWRTFQNNGGVFTSGMGGQLGGGIFFVVLAGFFLFDLSFGTYWPLLLIAIGVSGFLSAIGR